MRYFVIAIILATGCGSAPAMMPDNQPATGPIKINNASMRFTGMQACGQGGAQMCHDYDISFTLTNSASSSGSGIFRFDTAVLTINGQSFAPTSTPSCSAEPWLIGAGATSQVIDLHLQTDIPTLHIECGSATQSFQLTGPTMLPSTGTIGLALEGVLADATPFKATTTVTVF
jgi:hypothetical protein